MSSVIDVIKRRRSIRKYLTVPVPKESLLKVLEAAGWAPSAHNSQPYRFIILENATSKRKLAEAMSESWLKDMAKDGVIVEESKRKFSIERFANAPVLFVACLTMDGMRNFPDDMRRRSERDLAVQSLGAAIQNMLLVANVEGLGACWFSAPSFCKETVRKVLEIPENVEPQALIAIGYPDEKVDIPKRRLLSDYCFRDSWEKAWF